MMNSDALSHGGQPEPVDPEDNDSTSDGTIQAICIILQPDMPEHMRQAHEEDEALTTVQNWVIRQTPHTILEQRRLSPEAAT